MTVLTSLQRLEKDPWEWALEEMPERWIKREFHPCDTCETEAASAFDVVLKRPCDDCVQAFIYDALMDALPGLLGLASTTRELLAVMDGEELDLGSCPYLRNEGMCASGCSQEPECVTCIPEGGWPSDRARAALTWLET